MSEAFGRVEWPFLSRKDPHLPTFGQKRQYPLQHNEESVREPDQEIDVHDRPDNPRRKSGESEHAKIGERVLTPRNREIAFVPIPEGRRRRLSRHASSNQRYHVPSRRHVALVGTNFTAGGAKPSEKRLGSRAPTLGMSVNHKAGRLLLHSANRRRELYGSVGGSQLYGWTGTCSGGRPGTESGNFGRLRAPGESV
jgi:hypothetical protein